MIKYKICQTKCFVGNQLRLTAIECIQITFKTLKTYWNSCEIAIKNSSLFDFISLLVVYS